MGNDVDVFLPLRMFSAGAAPPCQNMHARINLTSGLTVRWSPPRGCYRIDANQRPAWQLFRPSPPARFFGRDAPFEERPVTPLRFDLLATLAWAEDLLVGPLPLCLR